MDVEEKRILLPKRVNGDECDDVYKYNDEHGDKSWNSARGRLYMKIIIAIFLAITSLVAVSYITLNVDNKKIDVRPLKLSFDDHKPHSNEVIKPRKFDSVYGPDGQVYCDELGNGECLQRFMGMCTKHGPCVLAPSTAPSSSPTVAPSNLYVDHNCNPHNPPCAEWFLGICTKHYHCHQVSEPCEDNEDDDDAAHLKNGDCDPENPPCVPGELIFGICWEYEKCPDDLPNSSSPPDNITRSHGDENKSSPSSSSDDQQPHPSPGSGSHPVTKIHSKNSTTSEEGESSGKNTSVSGSAETEPRSDPAHDGNITKSEKRTSESAHGSDEVSGDDFLDFKWIEFNISIPFFGELTSQPTLEPTQIHACDPSNPPCSKYEVGVCVEYETCFGVHSTPHNTTQEEFNDDEGFTFDPTPMPVPNPTEQPTEQPTSTPTTTMPTPEGYTFEPTISMMPTAAETFHPTTYLACDPENPPCDHYFFGVCLGVRYCFGSHQPTPMPTIVPVNSSS